MKPAKYFFVLVVIMLQFFAVRAVGDEQVKLEKFFPGEFWLDNKGVHVNAHGGGVLFHDGVYYWFGEHKTEGRRGNRANVGVHCYSSSDLYNWKDEGIALAVSDDPNSDITKGCILERPKVIYNEKTKKFVMWFHLELIGQGYNSACSGMAVADSVMGPYTFLKSFRPNGQMARDMTLFVDEDKKAYHLYASEDNETFQISLLTEDYLGPDGKYERVFVGRYMEAPAICKRQGKYYFIGSGCTGWKPNEARSAMADFIWGSWKELGNPCEGINPKNGLGKEKTFGCQSTFILPVHGKKDAFIAMFDMWRPGNAIDGRYVWLPIQFTDEGFKIGWRDEWDMSAFDNLNTSAITTSTRTYIDFDFDWRFSKGEFPTAMMPDFNDSDWRKVDLPHDWSIEGPFSAEYSSGNGYVPGGVGWYRKSFTLQPDQKDKVIAIEFDGVYNNSEVWINGHFMGRRPYGYSSFQYDLTPHVKFGSEENVITVRVDHSKYADSRWYTGSGIYRHVRLCITDKLHIGHWGTYVTTPKVEKDSAVIRIETTLKNEYAQDKTFALQSDVVTAKGDVVASLTNSGSLKATREDTIIQEIKIKSPQLWSIESPVLYTLRSRLESDSKSFDETETDFGIRTIRFDADKGFFLNDKPVKLKGVCLHHDAGCLGAAVPEKVLERRLLLMKELGANAIRTSHNPPAPELLDICDRIGLLVKDEAFDEFTPPKNKWVSGWNVGRPSRFGYGEVFAQWSVIDMEDMVRRDRNHPSIIMWSISNEIDYTNDPFSHSVLGEEYRPDHPSAQNLVKHARPLIEAVKKLDRTRPVTAALANIPMSNAVGLPQLLDVVGYNYQEQYYEADHETYPNRFIFGSENNDRYSAWTAVRDNDYVAGQFLWTGIDYLGEARRWPDKANGSGLLDLCGFKKPLAWFRQSLWSDEPMVYICVSDRQPGRRRRMRAAEHWNWPQDSTVTVFCYTNCPEVALTLNDKSVGTMHLSEAEEGVLRWQVPFESGTLKAVGRNNGKAVCEYVLRTATSASRIELLPDVTQIRADGKDICHIEFRVVDDNGVRVPDAQNEITFEVEGPGRIIGIENGNLSSHEDYKDSVHKAYHGRGLVILQSLRERGRIRLAASSNGIKKASVEIDVQR